MSAYMNLLLKLAILFQWNYVMPQKSPHVPDKFYNIGGVLSSNDSEIHFSTTIAVSILDFSMYIHLFLFVHIFAVAYASFLILLLFTFHLCRCSFSFIYLFIYISYTTKWSKNQVCSMIWKLLTFERSGEYFLFIGWYKGYRCMTRICMTLRSTLLSISKLWSRVFSGAFFLFLVLCFFYT